MRTINTQEVQAVSGAGLLTSGLIKTTKVAVAAGTAVGTGLVAAGTGLATGAAIVAKPVATGAYNVIKFLI
jgi:hypothetical protein